ncbi:MAG: hypothetical protein MZV64_59110 [Ignavibacteriales bacterium]|nr:hypothetical protein [Ignavibacteriales bacterium]
MTRCEQRAPRPGPRSGTSSAARRRSAPRALRIAQYSRSRPRLVGARRRCSPPSVRQFCGWHSADVRSWKGVVLRLKHKVP